MGVVIIASGSTEGHDLSRPRSAHADHDLFTSLCSGRAESIADGLAEAHRRYQHRLQAWAAAAVGVDLAEDVTQDTFARLWLLAANGRIVDRGYTLLAVLVAIARRVAGEHRRRLLSGGTGDDREAEAHGQVVDPAAAAALAAVDVKDSLELALTRLTERQRAVFWLRAGEDLPSAAVARLLGMRADAVDTAYLRARRSLQRYVVR